MVETRRIERIEAAISTINNLQIAIESSADADTLIKMFGYKDGSGNVYKCLVKDENIFAKGITANPDLSAGELINLFDTTLTYGFSMADVAGDAVVSVASDIMYLSDKHLLGALTLSEAGETGLDTVSNSIVGAINEVLAGADDAEMIQGEDVEDRAIDVNALGPQLFVDPFMTDDPAFGDYTFVGAPTVTQVSNGDGGLALRMAYNATANPSVEQSVLDIGDTAESLARVRSDATRTVRLRNGSWASGAGGEEKEVGTDWVYFAIRKEATVVGKVVIDLIESAGYIEIDYMLSRKVRDIKNNHVRPDFQWLENGFTYSEDISNADWLKTRCEAPTDGRILSPVIDRDTNLQVEYKTIISNTDNLTHHVSQGITCDGSTYTARYFFQPGDKTWVYLLNTTTTKVANVDLVNLVPGTVSATVEVAIIKHADGVEVLVEYPTANGVNSILIYPATADNGITFAGDGATVDTYFTGAQFYKGTIADNFPYVKTEASAETGKHEYVHEAETVQEYRARLGLLERLDSQGLPTGIWETPQESIYGGTDYVYAWNTAKGERYQKFVSDSVVTGNPVLNTANKIINGWGWLQDGTGNVIQLGAYFSSGTNSGLSVASGNLTLTRGSNYDDAADSYEIHAVYTV